MIERIFKEEPDPMSSDIWQNVNDATFNLDSKCNLFASGITSLAVLYNQDRIANWAVKEPMTSKALWAVFGYFAIQLYSDWNKIYAIYGSNFGSHFDTHSMANLFGRFTNAFVNFLSIYLLASAKGTTIIA